MPRAFVAVSVNPDPLVRLLEAQDIEAIPLTRDSVIENVRSLESSTIVIVDVESPEWVMREAQEHHKLTVAFGSAPEGQVTALVVSYQEFEDLMAMLRPFANPLTPVSESYVRRLAIVKSLYPVRRTEILDSRP